MPYVAARRAGGASQYGLKQLFGLFTRSLFDFSSVPLHAGLVLGGIALGLSALYLLVVLAWLLIGPGRPPGWAAGLPITLLLHAITLAFLGIIGVYVARIYNEVRGRPTYVLSRIRRHS